MGVGKDLAKTSQVVGGGTKSQPSANKVTSLLITVLLASLECLWSTRHARGRVGRECTQEVDTTWILPWTTSVTPGEFVYPLRLDSPIYQRGLRLSLTVGGL